MCEYCDFGIGTYECDEGEHDFDDEGTCATCGFEREDEDD